MFTRKNGFLAVVLVAFFILILIGTYFVVRQEMPCAGSENKTRKEKLDCFVQYYTALTQKHGVSLALSGLEKQSGRIGVDCHQIAHAIGRTAVMQYDTVGEAFKNGSAVCMSGFYHGAVEGALSKYGETLLRPDSIDTICGDFRSLGEGETLNLLNCTHGIGHGILDFTHDDLYRSLKICGFLSIPSEKENCYGGVFMENLLVDGKNHISKYVKDDDIFYPCTAVDEEYKKTCYVFQPIHILYSSNFHEAFLTCSRAEKEEYKTTCYGGIGVQTNSSDISLARKNLFFCLKGETFAMQSACVFGAASAYLFYHNEDHTGLYCANLPKDLGEVCRGVTMQHHF